MAGLPVKDQKDIDYIRTVKLTNGSGQEMTAATTSGFSEPIGEFVIAAEQGRGTGTSIPVVAVAPVLPPWGRGIVKYQRDADVNDSDKTITVPANKIWSVLLVVVNITCSADVGNRYIGLGIANDLAALVWASQPVGPITATQVGQLFASPGMPTSTTARRSIATAALNVSANVQADTSLPSQLLLLPGYSIHALDTAAVAAAADDMILEIHYIEYDA